MANISKDKSKFWEHSSYDLPNYSKNEDLDYSFNLKIPPIPKLKDPSIHYRCPKCYNFPFIEFKKNKEDISYFCACSKDTKFLTIKELFAPENKYLTFLNNKNENQNNGFKCTIHKSDNSGKNKKFKYFCFTCNDNLCKDCLLYHLNKNHDVINLEFQKLEMNEKIELINKKLNELKTKNEDRENITFYEEKSIDNKYDNNNKTIKFENLDNGDYKKEIPPENKKLIVDIFMELINIIINDYIEYPNYYHFFNIHLIYNIFFDVNMKDNKDNDFQEFSNQEITVIFLLNGNEIKNIKCYLRESIEDICKNENIDLHKYILLYNGNKINIKSRLESIIGKEEKEKGIIKILLYNEVQTLYEIKMSKKIQSKDIICPRCGEIAFMNIKDYKINLFDCINKHKINNLLLNEFKKTQNIDLSNIICNICRKRSKYDTFEHVFYTCLTCRINICPNCNLKHDKNHNITKYDEKDYFCVEHKETYINYCSQCKVNICLSCESKHKNHNKILFNRYNKNQLLNEINKFMDNIDNLNNIIKEIIDKFHDFKYKINLFNELIKNMVKNYDDKHLNYQILQNIKEVLDFKKCISNDILTIINENDIIKRVNYIMNLDYKINNINEEDYSNEIISYKFFKEPQNLKYKLNIIETNDFIGVNDIFEVFVCNKDHKEYLVSKNINNYNLDVYTLLDNKKSLSLPGHKNRITTIRYFIDNIYINEYLISADINGIVILWDIINPLCSQQEKGNICNLSTKGIYESTEV